ncbi:hypothetical protein I307_03747 [Cryptococcus deuterogattii 99/473]|nr:hypothetical protein I307_03747 [Cryptococcus deuterogattii 99/473]
MSIPRFYYSAASGASSIPSNLSRSVLFTRQHSLDPRYYYNPQSSNTSFISPSTPSNPYTTFHNAQTSSASPLNSTTPTQLRSASTSSRSRPDIIHSGDPADDPPFSQPARPPWASEKSWQPKGRPMSGLDELDRQTILNSLFNTNIPPPVEKPEILAPASIALPRQSQGSASFNFTQAPTTISTQPTSTGRAPRGTPEPQATSFISQLLQLRRQQASQASMCSARPSVPAFSHVQHTPHSPSAWHRASNSSGNPITSSIPQQQCFSGYNPRGTFNDIHPRIAQVPAAWAPGTNSCNLTDIRSNTTDNHNQTACQKESSFWDIPTQQTSSAVGSSKSVKDMYKDWLSGQDEDAKFDFNEHIGTVKQAQDEIVESTERTDRLMNRTKQASAFISARVAQCSDEVLKTDVATLSSLMDELTRDLALERTSRRTVVRNQNRTLNAVSRAHRLAKERAKIDNDPDLARSRKLWQTYRNFRPRSERSQALRSDWEEFMDNLKDETTESILNSADQKASFVHRTPINSTFTGTKTSPYTYFSQQSRPSTHSSFIPSSRSFYSQPGVFQNSVFRR